MFGLQQALAAIARRRKLLTDEVLIALVDNSWEFLDISESSITDTGLAEATKACKNIKAADIRYVNYMNSVVQCYIFFNIFLLFQFYFQKFTHLNHLFLFLQSL